MGCAALCCVALSEHEIVTRRTPNAVDEFPLGELGAEWLCGTTQKPMAKVAISNAEKFKVENFSEKNKGRFYSTGPPVLTGPVVELAAMKAKLNETEMALTASRSALEGYRTIMELENRTRYDVACNASSE